MKSIDMTIGSEYAHCYRSRRETEHDIARGATRMRLVALEGGKAKMEVLTPDGKSTGRVGSYPLAEIREEWETFGPKVEEWRQYHRDLLRERAERARLGELARQQVRALGVFPEDGHLQYDLHSDASYQQVKVHADGSGIANEKVTLTWTELLKALEAAYEQGYIDADNGLDQKHGAK